MRRMITFVALGAVLVATPAAGHEKGDRAMGVVESVSAERRSRRSSRTRVIAAAGFAPYPPRITRIPGAAAWQRHRCVARHASQPGFAPPWAERGARAPRPR